MVWRQPNYGDQKRTNNFAGGLNNSAPASLVDDNQSSEESGLCSYDHPGVTTRKGITAFGTPGTGEPVLLLKPYGSLHMVRVTGSRIYYNDGVLYDQQPTWNQIAYGLTEEEWDAVVFNGKLLMTNGEDPVKSWNGTALTDLSVDAPTGKYISSDGVRVWIAKAGKLYYSAFQDETDWISAENSGEISFGTSDFGDITGLYFYRGRLCVFKEKYFSEVIGTNYYNMSLQSNSTTIGCVSHKTIQEVEGTLFWLGVNNVYAYQGGNPQPIGESIMGLIESINPAYRHLCWGGTDGKDYYLGLVTGANTEADTVVMLDVKHGIWRKPDIKANLRYSCNIVNQWYIGNNAGQVYKMEQGTSDEGTAIPYSVTSKAFDEEIPEAEKEYIELHVQAYVPTGSTLTVAVSTEDRGENFTTVHSTTTTDESQQSVKIIIPLDTIPLAYWFRYRISGTGPVTINSVTRYFRIMPTVV